MATEDNNIKPDQELTGPQDLSQSIAGGAGFLGPGLLGGGAPSTLLAYGSAFGSYGSGAGGFDPLTAAFSMYTALLGSGTQEGTNRYSPNPLIVGGAMLPGMMPGYSRPWPGTYATYRIMSAHPTLVLAAMATILPILSAGWTVEEEKNDKAPKEARQFIDDTFSPKRANLLNQCLRSLTFGSYGGEKVFEVKNGYWSLKRIKWLLPELNEYLVDGHGGFAGIRNLGVELPPEKCFIHTHDKEGDNYYGRSRHENCRRVWSNYLSEEDNLFRLATKSASIIPRVGFPPGFGQNAQGATQSNFDAATQVGYGMMQGRPVVYPNLSNMSLDDVKDLPAFAKASLWSIDTLDMGNPGPAISALVDALKYYDVMMVRGWGQPERSLLEARHGGSRADSESHGDLSVTGCEAVYDSILDSINEQLVDPLLLTNFGPEAVGTVRIKAVPMIDDKMKFDEAMIEAIGGNPGALKETMAHMDMNAWIDRVGLPRDEEAEEDWKLDQVVPQAAQQPGDDPAKNNANTKKIVGDRMKKNGHSKDAIDAILNKRQTN